MPVTEEIAQQNFDGWITLSVSVHPQDDVAQDVIVGFRCIRNSDPDVLDDAGTIDVSERFCGLWLYVA